MDRENELPPIVPLDVLRSPYPVDVRVYTEAVLLDHTRGADSFTLPARNDFARLCNCSVHTLNDSLHRLHEAGWLKVIRPPGKSRRRIVILKYLAAVVSARVVVSQGNVAQRSDALPPPEFSAALRRAHKACKNSDRQGSRLSDYSLDLLYNYAGRPADGDMLTALLEADAYTPARGGTIGNMLTLFLSRFESDGAGKRNGRLCGTRKNQRPLEATRRQRPGPDLQALEDLSTVSPAKTSWPADRIDDVFTRIATGRFVSPEELPPLKLPPFAVELYGPVDQQAVELRAGVICEQLAPGYWRLCAPR